MTISRQECAALQECPATEADMYTGARELVESLVSAMLRRIRTSLRH
ncbi:hypothetical protein ACFTWF_03810 [Rhodococcus sp. NPDC056960]